MIMAVSARVVQFLSHEKLSVDNWKIFQSLASIVVFCIVLVLFKYALQRRRYNKHLPGRKLNFIDVFGNLADFPLKKISRNGLPFNTFVLQILNAYAELFRKQKLFCFWISYVPFICLVKAEAVEAFISGTKNTEKGWSYNMLQPLLGEGLLTSHGKKWKSRRKLLTPSFHFEILKDFLPVFNEQAQILVKRLWRETTEKFTDIVPLVTYCSLDMICETTLGVSIGAQKNSESQYVRSVTRSAEIITERMIQFWYWSDFIFGFTEKGKLLQQDIKVVHDFTRSVITERKKKILNKVSDQSKTKRKAFMDILLEHHIENKSLSEEDIREEVDTFTFGGHESTAMGMSWALYLIGLHKDIQEKIQEELDRIFGEDSERSATTEDINDMKYLECVLKESQRLYPSIPFTARHVSEDTTICDYEIPKGATCIISTYQLHRDKEIFPDPEKFDPDRFLPVNSVHRHPYAYVPFSAGPRNCIGQRYALMEEKIVVSTILRNFSIESLDQRDKLPPVPELILRSPMPIRIQVRPRQKLAV